MSILIKGAKMPSNCMGCPYEIYVNCIIYQALSARDYSDCRHPDCPIVEIPPHGDLIEKEELLAELELEWNACNDDTEFANKIVPNCIKNAPVIIESEEE